jgi:hypothetical protein
MHSCVRSRDSGRGQCIAEKTRYAIEFKIHMLPEKPLEMGTGASSAERGICSPVRARNFAPGLRQTVYANLTVTVMRVDELK